jgi:hypothetical protein
MLFTTSMADESPRPRRPTLFLLEQTTEAVYVVPLVIAEEQVGEGNESKFKQVALQFAKARRKIDLPSAVERTWYELYDYDPLGRDVETGATYRLGKIAPDVALPAVEFEPGTGFPRLKVEYQIPECDPTETRHVMYRDGESFHIDLARAVGGRWVVYSFAEYAPLQELFGCTSNRDFRREKLNETLKPYRIPGDARLRDTKGNEVGAIVYSSERSKVAAVLVAAEGQSSALMGEQKRILIDLSRNPSPISDQEGRVLGPTGAPASWLLGVPLRYGFFNTNETPREFVIPPGQFRRLSSIAVTPLGVVGERSGKRALQLTSSFEMDAKSKGKVPIVLKLPAANLEQHVLFDRFDRIDAGVVASEIDRGPRDWLVGGSVFSAESNGKFYDRATGNRHLRFRERLLHSPSGAGFRLVFGENGNVPMYFQETEVSIGQWRKFLGSEAGLKYLADFAEDYEDKLKKSDLIRGSKVPEDPLERFLLLAAMRMKDGDGSRKFGESNRETALQAAGWAPTRPMVYITASDAEAYCTWIAAGMKEVAVRLPTTEEWRMVARAEELEASVARGAKLSEIAWLERLEPHDVGPGPGVWTTRGAFVSMFGNVGELVSDGDSISALGASYRTSAAEIKVVSAWSRPLAKNEASIFVGFRPILVPN